MPFGPPEVEDAWLAALILGEGSLYPNKRTIRIAIANSDIDILQEAIRIIGPQARIRFYPDKRQEKYKWRKHYQLVLFGGYREKLALIKRIRPYLVGRKATVADLLIKYLQARIPKDTNRRFDHHYTTHELELLRQVHELTKKGE